MASALILGPIAMGSDVFAQGGSNKANQGISQQNNAATMALCASGVLSGAQWQLLLQANPIQIQEATLLVKQYWWWSWNWWSRRQEHCKSRYKPSKIMMQTSANVFSW